MCRRWRSSSAESPRAARRVPRGSVGSLSRRARTENACGSSSSSLPPRLNSGLLFAVVLFTFTPAPFLAVLASWRTSALVERDSLGGALGTHLAGAAVDIPFVGQPDLPPAL